MITLAWFFDSVWGRRILMLVAILLAWFVIREHFIRQGEQKAQAAQQQQQLQQQTQAWQQERKSLLEGLAQATSAIQAASQAIAASQARERVIQNELLALAGQRKEADSALAKVPDSELHARIVQQLAVRPPQDTTAGYLPAEERALSQCLTDQPFCEQQSTGLAKQVAELQLQTHSTGEKYDALAGNYKAVVGYTGKLEAHYAELYNAFAAKKRGLKCLYLWHCVKQTISAPKPEDLALPASLAQVPN